MFKVRRTTSCEVVFTVIGRLEADNVGELSALLAREPGGRTIVLDLRELVLVDRQAVRLLRECEARGTVVRNCPGYIRVWMASGADDDDT
jgi:hypothetical protein